MTRAHQLWIRLSSSLWFLPSLMVAIAIALALGLIELDTRVARDVLERWPRLFGVGAEGSRGVLSAIAGSMITVTGVVFSITIVALALASSQYTPRILRNFMRDGTNQFVLGFFVGTFAYCLIVLRVIRGGDGAFVPSIAVVTGILLALISIGVLILFIHHIATSIQAANIIAGITSQTLTAIRREFPDGCDGTDAPLAEIPEDAHWRAVPAFSSGYVQGVDVDTLQRLARDRGMMLRIAPGVGDFVVERMPLLYRAGGSCNGSEEEAALDRELFAAFSIARFRTVDQDVAFGIRQIVDIALKALSPGINDTTTAVTCVDYLTAILAELSARRVAPARHYGQPPGVLIIRGPDFAMLVAESFDQIRNSASANVAVMLRILGAVETVSALCVDAGRRAILTQQVRLIAELAGRDLAGGYERSQVLAAAQRTLQALGSEAQSLPASLRTGAGKQQEEGG